jgi:4-amino-4-deoxy-L-arabinose transferase-like glycosyltransferase
LLGIALTVAAFWRRTNRSQGASPGLPWASWETALVVALGAFALAVRLWRIGDAPHVISGDEGSAGLTGWEFVTGARDNPLSLGWFTYPSLYFWLLSLPLTVLGRGVEPLRGVSAVAGAATVIAAYASFRLMFGRRVAAWAAVWLSSAHVHLLFSRIAYNNIFDPFFLVASAGLLWHAWHSSERRSFLGVGLCLGFSQYFYAMGRLTPVLLLMWIPFLARRRGLDRARLTGLAAAALTALAVVLPLLLLYAAHPDWYWFTSSRVSMLVPGWIEPVAKALGTSPIGLILEQGWITVLGLGVGELQGVYSSSGAAMLVGISLPLFLIGLGFSVLRIREPSQVLTWLVLAAVVAAGALSIEAPSSQRMLLLTPFLAVGVAHGLETFLAATRTSRTLAVVALFLVLTTAVWQNLHQLFGRYFVQGGYGGRNGEAAQAMIDFLRQEPSTPAVYFVGGERMGFASIPSVTYLLPDTIGVDLAPPYLLANGGRCALAFILPEERSALPSIEAQTRGGTTSERYDPVGHLVFFVRRSDPGGC